MRAIQPATKYIEEAIRPNLVNGITNLPYYSLNPPGLSDSQWL
jgi:hypothetical protein